MLPSSNFQFLNSNNAQLAQLGALAERYFRDDPATAIFKLRLNCFPRSSLHGTRYISGKFHYE
jgi:hypothetical protein